MVGKRNTFEAGFDSMQQGFAGTLDQLAETWRRPEFSLEINRYEHPIVNTEGINMRKVIFNMMVTVDGYFE
jgi:hypothetical protein